jgi:hypothetical protein
VQYLYLMDGVMARAGDGELRGWFTRGVGGWTFDAAWLALREPGWVRVGVGCARSGLAWASRAVRSGVLYAHGFPSFPYYRVWALPLFYLLVIWVFVCFSADFLLVDDPFRNKGVFFEASDSGSGMTCGVVRHLHGGEFRFIPLLVVLVPLLFFCLSFCDVTGLVW